MKYLGKVEGMNFCGLLLCLLLQSLYKLADQLFVYLEGVPYEDIAASFHRNNKREVDTQTNGTQVGHKILKSFWEFIIWQRQNSWFCSVWIYHSFPSRYFQYPQYFVFSNQMIEKLLEMVGTSETWIYFDLRL